MKSYAVLCLVIFLCTGCTSRGTIEKETLDERTMDQIEDKIADENWKIGKLQQHLMSEEEIASAYGIAQGDIVEAFIKQAIIPASCGEIAIFHIKDGNTSIIEQGIEKRVQDLLAEMGSLVIQQKIVEQYATMQVGAYYIFVTGEDAQEVIQYISSL